MRLIEALPQTPRAETLAPPSARAPVAPAAPATSAAAIVLSPRNGGALPFLAQCLAQEAMPTDGGEAAGAARWRERDTAYRIAAGAYQPALLSLDI